MNEEKTIIGYIVVEEAPDGEKIIHGTPMWYSDKVTYAEMSGHAYPELAQAVRRARKEYLSCPDDGFSIYEVDGHIAKPLLRILGTDALTGELVMRIWSIGRDSEWRKGK